MKPLKLLLAIVLSAAMFSSCSTVYNDSFDNFQPTLEDVVSGYDIWYLDYHQTTGSGDIPYVSRAFTLSFINGSYYFIG
jgi:hypothetical protein